MKDKDDICCSKEFYGKIDSDYDFSLYELSINNQIPFESDIPPILESSYINAHYLCPKCRFFPYIRFKNENQIYYTCGCNKEQKTINIEKLFDFNESNEYRISVNNNKEIHGLKCIHKNRNHKFRYYCTDCHINLCSECCENHLNKNHVLIIFDFNNKDTYSKINKIIEFLYSKENNNNDSYNSSSFLSDKKSIMKTHKIILDNNN